MSAGTQVLGFAGTAGALRETRGTVDSSYIN